MEDFDKEIKNLKRELFDLEKTFYHEKELLIGLINTLSLAASRYPGISLELKAIRELLDAKKPLEVEAIEKQLNSLKSKVLASEVEDVTDADIARVKELREAVSTACRVVRRMIVSITEDLYPLDAELSEKALQFDIKCTEKVKAEDFKEVSRHFSDFVAALRHKIEEDFKYINETFFLLLNQIKELEKTLTKDFGGEERIREIEYFEMNLNQEMGSIVRSFDIHTTIDEIKTVVMEKIKKIKEVVSVRKKQEMERARAAKENIERLQERIAKAERQAREMSKKAEELKTVAMKDGLTGLFNRKAFGIRIDSALKRTREYGEPFSLIMLDVDGFKEINDTFGHVAGDKVLKKVGECLKGSFRENDFIARYGGDEFAVIIEKMDRAMALERVEVFKKNLAKVRFVSHKKGEIRLTVSAGVAEATKTDSAESLIERADEELYSQKKGQKQ